MPKQTAKETRLLNALSQGEVDFEREKYTSGSVNKIRENLKELVRSRRQSFSGFAPYIRFTQLLVGVEVAETKLKDPALAQRLFRSAQKIFETPNKFEAHYLSRGTIVMEMYCSALVTYAPEQIEKSLPYVIMQHCTDVTLALTAHKTLEAMLERMPQETHATLGNSMIVNLSLQRNFRRIFERGSFGMLGTEKLERRAEIVEQIAPHLSLFRRFGTPRQRESLIQQVLAKQPVDTRSRLEELLRSALKKV